MNYDLHLLPHQYDLYDSASPKSCMVCGRGAGKTFALSAITMLDGGIVAKTKQAMDTGDAELLAMCDKASRMVGLDHQSSPDYAQRLQVEGNVDAEVKIRVIKDEPKNEQ